MTSAMNSEENIDSYSPRNISVNDGLVGERRSDANRTTTGGGLFVKLPASLLVIVLQHLDVISLCRLEQTCQFLRRALQQSAQQPQEEKHSSVSSIQHDNDEPSEKNSLPRSVSIADAGRTETTARKVSNNNDKDEIMFISNLISETCWKAYFLDRFKMHSSREQAEIQKLQQQKGDSSSFKKLYIRRNQLEWLIYKEMMQVPEANKQTADQNRILNFTSLLVTKGRDVMDLLWRMWTAHLQQQNEAKKAFMTASPTTILMLTAWSDQKLRLRASSHDGKRSILPELAMPPSSEGERPSAFKYATSYLRLVHCSSTLEDFMLCLMRQKTERLGETLNDTPSREQTALSSSVVHSTQSPSSSTGSTQHHLEDLMILVSQMFYDFSPETLEDTTSPWIREALDDLAEHVRQKLQVLSDMDDDITSPSSTTAAEAGKPDSAATATPKQIILALHQVLFEEGTNEQGPFRGNIQDYYNYQNSLLHTVLRKRKGLPLTLAILYQCIGKRVGLAVEIVGLPGHVVMYSPDLDRYIDVFAGGRFLTVHDCTEIVANYGLAMNPAFLKPLCPTKVILRVCNNLENAFHQLEVFSGRRTQRERVIVTVVRALLNNANDMQLQEYQNLMSLAWVSEYFSNTTNNGNDSTAVF